MAAATIAGDVSVSGIYLKEQTAPSSPPTGYRTIFVDSTDSEVKIKDNGDVTFTFLLSGAAFARDKTTGVVSNTLATATVAESVATACSTVYPSIREETQPLTGGTFTSIAERSSRVGSSSRVVTLSGAPHTTADQKGYGNTRVVASYNVQSSQSGSFNLQIGYDNTQSGSYNTQSGSYNTQSGYGNTQSGSYNTQSGSFNLQIGYGNTQSGSFNLQIGYGNTQSGSYNTQSGYGNTQSGSYNTQSGSYNTQSGSYGAQFGSNLNDGGYGHIFMIGDSKTATVVSRAYFAIDNGIWIKPIAAAPSTPENGVFYYDSTTSKFRGYAGGAWVDFH